MNALNLHLNSLEAWIGSFTQAIENEVEAQCAIGLQPTRQKIQKRFDDAMRHMANGYHALPYQVFWHANCQVPLDIFKREMVFNAETYCPNPFSFWRSLAMSEAALHLFDSFASAESSRTSAIELSVLRTLNAFRSVDGLDQLPIHAPNKSTG